MMLSTCDDPYLVVQSPPPPMYTALPPQSLQHCVCSHMTHNTPPTHTCTTQQVNNHSHRPGNSDDDVHVCTLAVTMWEHSYLQACSMPLQVSAFWSTPHGTATQQLSVKTRESDVERPAVVLEKSVVRKCWKNDSRNSGHSGSLQRE